MGDRHLNEVHISFKAHKSTDDKCKLVKKVQNMHRHTYASKYKHT